MTNLKLPGTPRVTSLFTSLVCSMAMVLAACGGGGGDTGGGGTTPIEQAIAPAITTQPDSQSVATGETATFSVTATGGTLSYQWKKNGTTIAGATSSTYTTPITSSADSGTKYSVSVSNTAGAVTSNTATLAVLDKAVAPAITTQPADQTAITGQTATFSVSATGTSLKYQWKKADKDIPGATLRTYTTPATSSADSGARYSVSVSNSLSTVTSNTVTLTVSDTAVAPSISSQPTAQSVTEGQSATFSVTASGTAPLIYQWQKDSTDISGATSSTYTTPATSSTDNGAQYSVVVINGAGTVISSKATLTVTATVEKPAITTQPAAQTVTEGESATFSVTASGTAPFTYQWKKNGTNIEGVTTSSHTTDATVLADSGAVFTVVVSNSAGTVTSSGATLTVNVPPAITAQPAAQTITAGDMATFSVTATGTGTLSYQWKKGSTVIPGATTSSYTTPAMGYAGNGAEYSVVLTDSVGTTTSSSARLTVTKTSTLRSYGYVANASDGLYDKTECVQDNNTGLVWEGKTASPATSRLGTSSYTNLDDTSSAQKLVSGFTYANPTQADIDSITNSIGYRNSVRTSNLCGYTDWRLPTKEELDGIFVSGAIPTIDTMWFPNTRSNFYWSSLPYPGFPHYAGGVSFWQGFGTINTDNRNTTYSVRLVR